MRCQWLLLMLGLVLTPVSYAQAVEVAVHANLRERLQTFHNLDFNRNVDDRRWEWDSRLYLKTSLRLPHGLSLVVEPQAIYIQDHPVVGGSQALTQADLYQAYLQYQWRAFRIRLGRQTLAYGDERLLGLLGWKDISRTHDGVKLLFRQGGMKLDAFAVHPADLTSMTPTAANPHGKSLVTWEDRRLLGLYATYTAAAHSGVDLYLINWRHNQHASTGPGRNINTFGARLFAAGAGFDASGEFVWQRGAWSNGIGQRAKALALKAGYTLPFASTRLGVEYDWSPGDDNRDPLSHRNFVFPFHTNHAHYGEMDRFSWANMRDLRFSLQAAPRAEARIFADVHLFWLDKPSGDWLNVAGTAPHAVYGPGLPTYVQRRAGTEVDVKVSYGIPMAGAKLTLLALYGVFAPGAAVRERNGGRADADRFAYLVGQLTF